ncbi:hypothetical protein LCGC14_1476740, partial [marine sediment metagenome]
MSIISREDPGLSQKQRLGKAFGICRAKEGQDFILGRINDFIEDIEKRVNVKTFIRTSKKGKASIVGKFERKIKGKEAERSIEFIKRLKRSFEAIRKDSNEVSIRGFSKAIEKEISEFLSNIEDFQLLLDLIEDAPLPGLTAAKPAAIREVEALLKNLAAPSNITNQTTGQNIKGKLVKGPLGQRDIPMVPIGSSNVRGAGTFKNELVVQFHQGPKQGSQRTYRYEFDSVQEAQEVWLSLLDADSAGAWIWEEVRGKKLGPAFFPPKLPTPGGTFSSKVPYDVSGRTPVPQVPNYAKLSEEMRKFKTGVKEPPSSREKFTEAELIKFQQKQAAAFLAKELPRFILIDEINRFFENLK